MAGDALKYNEVALRVLKKHPQIIVNDLYGFTLPNQKKWWTRAGNVHFAAAGRNAQGDEVARVIQHAMKRGKSPTNRLAPENADK